MEWFSSLRKFASSLVLSVTSGQTLLATHVGNIEIEKSINRKTWERRIWENVYYSEKMNSESLFSTIFMEKTMEKDIVFTMERASCV